MKNKPIRKKKEKTAGDTRSNARIKKNAYYKYKKHWIISQLYIFEERCGIRNSYLFFRLKNNKIMKNRKVEEDKRAQIALFSNTVQVKKRREKESERESVRGGEKTIAIVEHSLNCPRFTM